VTSGGQLFRETTGDVVNVRGVLNNITFRNEDNGYTVGRLSVEGADELLTIVGVMPGVQSGDSLALVGRWTSHKTYGRQFDVESCELRPPSGRDGLVRFLGSGRIKGVGPKTAEKIVDTLGPEVLSILEDDPMTLVRVPGISLNKARTIAHQLMEQKEASAALVFLQEYGLGPAHAQRVWKQYGPQTVERVRENPYRLADEVFGIGFRTADTLARGLGHEVDSAFRIAAGLGHLLGRAAMEGHVGLPSEELIGRGAPFLEVDEQRVESVLIECLEDGRLVEDGLVYHPELHAAETALATSVRRRLEDPRPLGSLAPEASVRHAEEIAGLELSPDQREAIAAAVGSRFSVITGGPGVGKTTLVRCLVEVLLSQGLRVALAAPTGRAARRLAAATGKDASTLHRLLGITPATMGFHVEREEPLTLDVLVVDETSMVDTALMAAVTKALPDDAGLVLVGDVDQLPSVGPGAVLADVIASGLVPVARLSTLFRQAETSSIVRVAHEINAGRVPDFDPGPDGQAFFIERPDPDDAVTALLRMVTERIPRKLRFDPLRDIQVITPIHSGPLGTGALNDRLRDALNPPRDRKRELQRFGRVYRQGDKVMQIKNNYDLNVFNGDIGILERIDDETDTLYVEFDDRRVEYGLDDVDQLQPAFAITCHKSQGSEFPAVVLPLSGSHFMMLRRNLVYTAFTRAKQMLVAIGEQRALQMAVSNPGSGDRHSRLAERLRGEL
jgi:exodeoxyribonuclease V alpha subunit